MQTRFAFWKERIAGQSAVLQFGLFRVAERIEVDFAVLPQVVGGEIGVALAERTDTLDVDLAKEHGRFLLEPFAFGEQITIFGNVGASGEHEVGGTLANAAGGIDIAAMYASRLLRDHIATESMFTRDAVARGEVENDLSALDGELSGRG